MAAAVVRAVVAMVAVLVALKKENVLILHSTSTLYRHHLKLLAYMSNRQSF